SGESGPPGSPLRLDSPPSEGPGGKIAMIRLQPERPILATSRLILRSPVAEDAPRIAELASDPGVARMTTSIPYPLTREQAEGFLERMEARDPAREEIFVIDLPGEGLIGLIGFHPGE